MEKFVTVLSAMWRRLCLQANIDTDKIIPARFLKTTQRTGLGKHAFDSHALSARWF
jgi:3-isopropylmalate/(R)-2-methylmalate dehydratase small subunit